MTKQTQQPIKEFRAGGISASVWNNQTQQNGVAVTRHSVRIQKRYCDRNGDWKDTDYFFPEDLPKLQLVAAKAFEFVSLAEKEPT